MGNKKQSRNGREERRERKKDEESPGGGSGTRMWHCASCYCPFIAHVATGGPAVKDLRWTCKRCARQCAGGATRPVRSEQEELTELYRKLNGEKSVVEVRA